MRLGDLDDLKTHISELILVYSGTELDCAILNAIDNAPTVALPPDNKYDEVILAHEQIAYERGVADGYAEAIEEGKNTRLQGKWIGKDRDSRGYCDCFECSNCGAYIYPHCLEKELDYNGCPYCFADMRGDKE